MRARRIPTVFVLSILAALALAATFVLARDGVRRAEAGGPPDQEINITVTDNLKATPLGNTCWTVFVVIASVNTPVDVVSDNNAKVAACDNLGPYLADLSDNDAALGSIGITIGGALRTTYGDDWHIQQYQAPPSFANNTGKYVCDLSLGKCNQTITDTFTGEPNIDGNWNFTIGTGTCTAVIVQTKGAAGNDPITITGTCNPGAMPFSFTGTGVGGSGVGGGAILVLGGPQLACPSFTALSASVSWNGNILSGLAYCNTLSSSFSGTRKPPNQQINITVADSVTSVPLPNTCWQVYAVLPGPNNNLVDVVSDNNAKVAACDSLGPVKSDLSDADPAVGSIKINISAGLRGTYGDQWHVQQYQAPAGYTMDSGKYACDLKVGKCSVPVTNVGHPPSGCTKNSQPDTDCDGCTDTREMGSIAGQGGQRNPNNFWDFGDMPNNSGMKDQKIRISDISYVVQRYHQDEPNGLINRFSDPLTTAIPPMGYHPAFDRGGVTGAHPWSVAPPDGKIRISDISYVVQQYHHDCV